MNCKLRLIDLLLKMNMQKKSVVTKSLTNMQNIGLETVILLFISVTNHYVGASLNPCFKKFVIVIEQY